MYSFFSRSSSSASNSSSSSRWDITSIVAPQQVRDPAATGHDELRVELGQRLEREAPLGEARVRDRRAPARRPARRRRASRSRSIVRGPKRGPTRVSPEAPLDRQQPLEQLDAATARSRRLRRRSGTAAGRGSRPGRSPAGSTPRPLARRPPRRAQPSARRMVSSRSPRLAPIPRYARIAAILGQLRYLGVLIAVVLMGPASAAGALPAAAPHAAAARGGASDPRSPGARGRSLRGRAARARGRARRGVAGARRRQGAVAPLRRLASAHAGRAPHPAGAARRRARALDRA